MSVNVCGSPSLLKVRVSDGEIQVPSGISNHIHVSVVTLQED